MSAPTDSATMNRITYAICVQFRSGYESVTIDGEPFPAMADFCCQSAMWVPAQIGRVQEGVGQDPASAERLGT